eukprot:294006-Rhodomonas_salina.1
MLSVPGNGRQYLVSVPDSAYDACRKILHRLTRQNAPAPKTSPSERSETVTVSVSAALNPQDSSTTYRPAPACQSSRAHTAHVSREMSTRAHPNSQYGPGREARLACDAPHIGLTHGERAA